MLISTGLSACRPKRKLRVSIAISMLSIVLLLLDGASAIAAPVKTVIIDNYYPYSFINGNGQPDGFSVELVKAVGDVMGVEVAITVGKWDEARAALKNGKIDLLPMMAYSEARDKEFDFSVPHTIAYDAVFVKKGMKITKIEDLIDKKIVVMNSDAAHDYINTMPWRKDENIIHVDTLPEALRLVAAGKGDVAIMPKIVGAYISRKSNLSDIESNFIINAYNRPFSFAVKDGNIALIERLNQGLSILKTDGTYGKLYEKWFSVYESPSAMNRHSLIALLSGVFALVLISASAMLWNRTLRRQVAMQTQDIQLAAKALSKSNSENLSLLRASKSVLDGQPFIYSARGILDSCRELIGASSGFIALLKEDGGINEIFFVDSHLEVDCLFEPSIAGLLAMACDSGKVVFENELTNASSGSGHIEVINAMISPLNIEGKAKGVIGLLNKQSGFSDDDARIATSFGELAALTLKNTRTDIELRETLRQVNLSKRQFRSLYELSQMHYTSTDELIGDAMEECLSLTNSTCGYFHMYDEAKCELVLTRWSKSVYAGCSTSQNQHYPLSEAGIWADCIRQRKAVIHNDYEAFKSSKGLPEGHFKIHRHMSVPILYDDAIVAVVGVGNKTTPYTESETSQLDLYMSSMLRMIREKMRIEEIATQDQLLRELRNRYEIATSSAKLGVWDWDIKNNIMIWDDRMFELYGITRDESTSNIDIWLSGLHPLDKEFALGECTAAINGDRDFDTEFRVMKPDGTVVWIKANAIINRDEHGVSSRMVGVNQDITARKNTEQTLIENSERISASLKEKDVLLKEIHHRVKNNMAIISALLSFQSEYVDDKKYRSMFMESQSRIRSMALVHEQLYKSRDFSSINVFDYISMLSQNIQNSFSDGRNSAINIDIEPISVEINELVPLGLTINEILTNCYKHGIAANRQLAIDISLKRCPDDKLKLSITDNGDGLPDDFDINDPDSHSKGLGLKLVDTLVSQINGKLSVVHKPASFVIVFDESLERKAINN